MVASHYRAQASPARLMAKEQEHNGVTGCVQLHEREQTLPTSRRWRSFAYSRRLNRSAQCVASRTSIRRAHRRRSAPVGKARTSQSRITLMRLRHFHSDVTLRFISRCGLHRARKAAPARDRSTIGRCTSICQQRSLTSAPVVTKPELMAHSDLWTTDPQVTKPGVDAFVADPVTIGAFFLGRYSVWTSSGSLLSVLL